MPPIFSTPPVSPPRRRAAREVGARAGLGRGEGRAQVAAERGHQVSPPEVLRAVRVDEVRAHQRLHAGRGGERHRAARQLLGEEAVGHHVGPGPAVGLRVAEAEVAQRAEAREELARELRALVEGPGRGHDLGVHEPRDGAAELLLLVGEADHARLAARRAAVASTSTLNAVGAPSRPTFGPAPGTGTSTTPYASRAASAET